MEGGKPTYSQVTDSGTSMSVKTELQIVKTMRLGIRGIVWVIKLITGFIGRIIKEMLHPGSTYR